MKILLFAALLIYFLIHPLQSGLGQDKSLAPADKKNVPVTELKNKILANLDTIKANYKEKIAELKPTASTPVKTIYRKPAKPPAVMKKTVEAIPAEFSLSGLSATDGTFLKQADSISVVAPNIRPVKKSGFLKRLFGKRKNK